MRKAPYILHLKEEILRRVLIKIARKPGKNLHKLFESIKNNPM